VAIVIGVCMWLVIHGVKSGAPEAAAAALRLDGMQPVRANLEVIDVSIIWVGY
jgi:hypothetical protein